jgi:cell division topological specificity factor
LIRAASYLWALLRKALRRGEGSGDTARERLQLVLVQDRSSLTLESMESMKNDLIDVISRYLVIDHESIEVEIKRSGGSLTLVSNIRVTDVKREAAHQIAVAEAEAG